MCPWGKSSPLRSSHCSARWRFTCMRLPSSCHTWCYKKRFSSSSSQSSWVIQVELAIGPEEGISYLTDKGSTVSWDTEEPCRRPCAWLTFNDLFPARPVHPAHPSSQLQPGSVHPILSHGGKGQERNDTAECGWSCWGTLSSTRIIMVF